MSGQHRNLLEVLVQFGVSGTLKNLEAAKEALEAQSSTSKSAKIPVSIALSAAHKFIEIIERNDDNNIYSIWCWNSLAVMCDRTDNSDAFELLVELQSTPVLSFVARAISSLPTDGDGYEAEFCLKFVCNFIRVDGTRQCLVGQTPGIMDSLLAQMDSQFITTSINVKIAMLSVLNNLISRLTSRVNIVLFVANDGFRIVNKTMVNLSRWAKIITSVRGFGATEVRVLYSCLMCVRTVYGVLQHADFLHSHCLATKYTLDQPAVHVTTKALYSLISISLSGIEYKESTITAFMSYCEYLRTVVPVALEATLLFSGDTAEVSFVAHFWRISRDSRLSHIMENVSIVLHQYTTMFSTVRAILDAERSSNAEDISGFGPVTVVCAHPGCHNNTINCNAMKKCSRCKAVSYCGKEHQTMHWKEHKKTCVPKV